MSAQDKSPNSADTSVDSVALNGAKKDELTLEQQRRTGETLEDLQERADAVDRVMTKNGPPEMDWTSG